MSENILDSDTSSDNVSIITNNISFTDKIFGAIMKEIEKKKYKDKIMKFLIEPLLDDINNKYYPHMMSLVILLILIIILLIGVISLAFYR